MKTEKRTILQKVYLTPTEKKLFVERARNYHSLSAMVRDAVTTYDDLLMKRKIEAFNQLQPLIAKHEADINRLGNNLNQVAHYTNILANNGKVEMHYVANMVEPLLHDIYESNRDIVQTEHAMMRKLYQNRRTDRKSV
jgi:hypothetical protein